MDYYPVFLNLQGRCCVVIGGGKVAEGKVQGLLAAEARVRVIAPTLSPAVALLARDGLVEHQARAYAPGDLAGAFLAIGATADPAVNEQVWQEAQARNILVNVVDDPLRCSFIAPAILRQGDLAMAISTGGKAPALAVRLREQMAGLVGPEHARFLELAGTLRERLAQQRPSFAERRALWYRLVDSDVIDLLRRGDERAARTRIEEITGIAPS